MRAPSASATNALEEVATLPDPPVEVTIRLFGWTPGESEVEISVPETSGLAEMLRGASPGEAARVFSRLHRRLAAELADAFAALEREPVSSH